MPAGTASPDAPEADELDGLPPTCEIRDFLIFAPGYHKGTLYTPEMNERVPANFERLKDHLTPVVKLGHDRQQRLAKSLGFLNSGVTYAVRPRPDVGRGYFSVSAKDVPTTVGAEVNAGRLNSGSVEVVPRLADPKDPAKDIEGPILTGWALLGEEQPAVKGFPPPKAVFADGTPVPASKNPAKWFQAMAEVMAASAHSAPADHIARFSWMGRDYSAEVISFSEMNMDPKAQLVALGLTPEQADQALKICGGKMADPAAPAPPAPGAAPAPPTTPTAPMSADKPGDDPLASLMSYADDPKADPNQKCMGQLAKAFSAFSKKFSDKLDEVDKRQGATEKMAEETQKKDEQTQMAAFSAQVERDVEGAPQADGSFAGGFGGKLAPAVRTELKKQFVALYGPGAKTYAAATDRLKAYSDHLASLRLLPDDPRLAAPPAPPPANGVVVTPLLKQMAESESLRRHAPAVARELTNKK